MSESENGGHDFVPSVAGSQRAVSAFDSDLSADENSHADFDSDREEQLLIPYPASKTPRPVSMDTVKRSSAATFADDPYVFVPEDDMVLELPLPDSPPMASNLLLQPTIYVAPDSRQVNQNSRSRSSSPSSIFSVENAEIHVAKKVTMVEPPTRPTLVFINSLNSRSKSTRPRSSHSRPRGNPRDRCSRMFLERTESTLAVPRLVERQPSPKECKRSTTSTPVMPSLDEEEPSTHSATISQVSEIPTIPYIPPSPRPRPQSVYGPRPRTAGSERPFPNLVNPSRPRRPTETSQRPPSIRSASFTNIHSSKSASSLLPTVEDIKPGYLADHNSDAASQISRACSPISTISSPPPISRSNKRDTALMHNITIPSILSHRTPIMRRMTRKHSTASSISAPSLQAEMTESPASTGISQQGLNTVNGDSHLVRKSSQRRHGRQNSSAIGGRGFMGLKLGKRAFAKS